MSISDRDSHPTESLMHPATSASAFSPLNASAGGGHLEYLTTLANDLGVTDVVATYFAPIDGRWADLRTEAAAWREAAETAGRVSGELDDHLGRLDAAWEGKDADAFIAYIGEIDVAGKDVEDAMNIMAGALEDVADAVERITAEMAELLTDTAEVTSQSALLPVGGETRARNQLLETEQSAKALYETARDVLEAFSRFCNGVDGPDAASRSLEISHPYPQHPFAVPDDGGGAQPTDDDGATSPSSAKETPGDASKGGSGASPLGDGKETTTAPDVSDFAAGAVTGAAATATAGVAAGQGFMGAPMMPMGMGGGMGGGGGASDHKVKPRTTTKPSELFGEAGQVTPAVIGEDPTPKASAPKDGKSPLK
jgi:uncharacterized protein YukE